LEIFVSRAHFLMGIGAGTDAASSGEKAVMELVRERGKPPYIVFDVGANRGQYLGLVLGSFAANDVSVHCFEPSEFTFQQLERDFAERCRDNVRLNNCALGKEPAQLTLYYDKPGSGLASLTRRRLDHFGIQVEHSEQVAVETIDRYCQKHHIDQIDLLKLDVEGHEMDVLAGASEMFARNAIGVVTFEFGGCNIDTRSFFQDYFYFFRDAGMRIYRISPRGYLRAIDRYQEACEQFRTTNFVAVRAD
jgi:FkbM family methyltransferase